ncbi:beta-sesquiphellandrene synthase-like [Dorcoceras hygrometricum]|uniref:Beta-sesquiphellandrene synthase-like n=1 Tax=Dorcoceras hygrometricum TaxID=472368 RepID=A0A2Z7BSN4_9LAMI|nr:beta-sesquiphellandrene synthase-like [Dorcoceras hygrometricum]
MSRGWCNQMSAISQRSWRVARDLLALACGQEQIYFDYCPFEAVERLEEESVKLLVYEDFWRNLTAHPLALFEPFGCEIWLILMAVFALIDDLIESHVVTGRQMCRARKVQRYHRSGDCRIRVSPSSCDGLTGPDDHGPMISTGRLAVRGIEALLR